MASLRLLVFSYAFLHTIGYSIYFGCNIEKTKRESFPFKMLFSNDIGFGIITGCAENEQGVLQFQRVNS